MMSSLKIKRQQKAELKVYKRALHGQKAVTVLMIGKDKMPISLLGTLSAIGQQILDHNQNGYDAYMLVNHGDGQGRKAENITGVNALFVDMDGGGWASKTVQEILALFQLQPHLIVNTSPGNYHVYWLITGVELSQFKAYQQRLAEKFETDPKVCDLPRVMRVPGTFNYKRDPPNLARLVHIENDLTAYSSDEFSSAMFESGLSSSSSFSAQSTYNNQAINVAVSTATPTDQAVVTMEVGREQKLQEVELALKKIPADDRNDWVQCGMALKSAFGEDGYPLFVKWSQTSPKFDAAEAKRQWDSFSHAAANGIGLGTIYHLAKHYGLGFANHSISPIDQPNNLFDLATQFVSELQHVLKYDPRQKHWHAFINGLWLSEEVYSESLTREFIRKLANAPYRNPVAGKLLNISGVKELLKTAAMENRCHIRSDVFNADPNIIGVRYLNAVQGDPVGIIDLTTGLVRPAMPEDFITKVLGSHYESHASCPKFMVFLDQITDGDQDLISAIREIGGYSLFGHTKAQLMFSLVGDGSNGKGVLLNIFRQVFGEYCSAIHYSLIRQQNTSNPNAASPAVAALVGARLIVCSEFPKDAALEEPFVKSMTGNDPLSCRNNYGNQMTFIPQGTLFLVTNYFPKVSFDHDAMWRRIYPIHLTRQFRGENCDPDLEDTLKLELPGILNWLIAGAVCYHSKGHISWAISSSAYLKTLKRETDTVGTWLKDCCDKGDYKVQSSVAYSSYKEHAKNNNAKPVSNKEFKDALLKKGHASKHTKTGNVFEGFRVKPLN